MKDWMAKRQAVEKENNQIVYEEVDDKQVKKWLADIKADKETAKKLQEKEKENAAAALFKEELEDKGKGKGKEKAEESEEEDSEEEESEEEDEEESEEEKMPQLRRTQSQKGKRAQ
ncbi:hypothetical protein VNI00_017325 [Paramarasmius palmivorus]|uniref:Uncharacterized protein n=1 Tax=Paramarasmius palmivorus TaxID=297713 RepID=A0AAW0B846_9AGAR